MYEQSKLMNQTTYGNMASKIDTTNLIDQAAAFTIDGGVETPSGLTHGNSTAQLKNSSTNYQASFDQYFLGGANSSKKHLATLDN